ncbi:hypothetical protein ABZZ17_24190 [Streptomyces sp. NPDC006512]|uniref:hypothetical protein n=1 Tax=Streptomyces sp. NPDC006512 TaxID=3154307 RepID=UPI0033A1A9D2
MITPVYGESEVQRRVLTSERPGVVEVVGAAASYAFICEERAHEPDIEDDRHRPQRRHRTRWAGHAI